MCSPPSSARSSRCSGRRTTLTSGMPSSRQIATSILPRFDAAAVWTSAVWPSARIVSTIASAVIGLTNSDAPSAAVASSGSSTTPAAGRTR